MEEQRNAQRHQINGLTQIKLVEKSYEVQRINLNINAGKEVNN